MIKIDKDTIWEETGRIQVFNFPAGIGTQSYVRVVYRETKRGIFGWKEVLGEAHYFDSANMPYEIRTLAIIIGNAQNAIHAALPKPKGKTT